MKISTARYFLIIFILITSGSCEIFRNPDLDVFTRAFPPCDVCTAVRICNRKSGVETFYDSSSVQTLRNVHDSLVIKQNGAVVTALPNLKQIMEDRKHRRYYFQSVNGSQIKTIRFSLIHSAETPLVTSLVIDGEYSPFIDTVDIYYRQR